MALYYTRVELTAEEWLDLDWWEAALEMDICVQAYSCNHQGCLGVAFGDGSRLGTGGAMQLVGKDGACPVLNTLMGTW